MLTGGPIKGRRVLLLEPFETFRLLDLPPELRGMIYDILLNELKPTIKMGCRKFSGQPRRPIRYGEWHLAKNPGVRDGATIAEQIELEPTAVVLAQVNKQISEEFLPLVYNTNFQFADTTSLNVFLERIGSTRQHLRHISLPREHGYTGGRGPKTFGNLIPASALRSLTINHISICSTNGRYGGTCSLEQFKNDILPLMESLHESREGKDGQRSVLDIVHVASAPCIPCSKVPPPFACKQANRGCMVLCHDQNIAEHCEDVKSRFRALLAQELEIEA